MKPEEFNLNKRLAADTHHLFKWHDLHVLLHKNATLPWVIVVPETDVIEFHDLSTAVQLDVLKVSQVIAEYFKAEHGAEKINFAAIGNVVQQLHIHVIGRHSKDPLWPDVVWGNQLPERTYLKNQLQAINTALITQLTNA